MMTMTTGGTTMRHNDGKGQHGNRRHNDGKGKHGDGRHGDDEG
jgi:hypothetical protein